MKILVVEDDRAVAQSLHLLFSSFRYAVDIARDGEAGLQMAQCFEYDLILLDILLPRLDGIELCKKLRDRGSTTPILLLTGQGGGHQKAIALNAGADDYVVKPFDAEELIARVQALLRRGGPQAPPVLAWGNLSIDPASRQATYGTDILALTPKEFAIVEVLLRNPQSVLSPQAILDRVWDSLATPGEDAIRAHIKEIRKKLKALGAPKDLIKTVYRTGYRLNPMYEETSASLTGDAMTAPQIAEMKSANEELRTTVNALHAVQSELSQKNQALSAAYQIIENEQQELQAAHNRLEQRVAERTAELVEANHQLQQRNHQWQALFEHALDAILIADDTGCYVDANPAAAELLGVSLEEVKHACIHDFADPQANTNQLWQQFLDQGKMSGEFLVNRPDGTTRETEFTAIANFISGRHLSILRDISDRKQAEAQLHELSQRLALATNAAKIGVWDFDIVENRLIWDDRMYALYGLAPAEFGGAYEAWQQGVHPEDMPRAHAEVQAAIAGEQDFHTEFRVLWPDGQVRFLEAHGIVLKDTSGTAQRMIGVNWDITERKQAEAALRASEARRQLALEGSGAGVWDWNISTGDVYLSRQWCEMLGYRVDELAKHISTWETLIHPADRPWVMECLNDHLQNSTCPYTFDYRLKTKSGQWKWIGNYGKVVVRDRNGNPLRMAGLHRDITERKRAEQKIREQAALIDIATDAIFVRDVQNRILFWSHGAERLYGWTADEAIGQFAHELFRSEADTELEVGLKTAIADGTWRGELVQTTKTGDKVMVASRWTLVQDTFGQPQSLLVVNTDITEKKQLEAQFYQAQRLESLGSLASGIAHDLNNVLTPVLTVAQVLRLTHPDLEVPVKERLKLIEESAKRGANMVKQILTFSRGGNGEPALVEIVPLLQDVASILQQSLPKSIDVHLEVAEGEPVDLSHEQVFADPTHLHQVLMNLCVNARDAMPEGGRLTLTAEYCQVDTAFARKHLDAQVGAYVAIAVTDTGTGIAPEVRDLIFDPFFTTKEPGKGTGLGLSTVLGLVKDCGGFLQVLSEPDCGTTIKVYLPVADIKEAALADNSGNGRSFVGHDQQVLIVDDDVDVRSITQLALESQHYLTLTAKDGVEAVELFAQHQDEVDLVILDMMMPNMSGILLIEQLRAMDSQVEIIAVSGLPANRDLALAAGASAFLSKPYDLKDLLKNVSTLVTC